MQLHGLALDEIRQNKTKNTTNTSKKRKTENSTIYCCVDYLIVLNSMGGDLVCIVVCSKALTHS